MVMSLSIAAIAAVVFLGWNLYRPAGLDRIAELNERRRTTSRMVSREAVPRWHLMLPPRRSTEAVVAMPPVEHAAQAVSAS